MERLESTRLRMERLDLSDATFIVELVNDPTWIAGIGDRNLHTIEAAENYLRNGPFSLYEKYEYGPMKMILKSSPESKDDNQSTGKVIGMCGLFKRPYLEDPDIGYALLSAYQGQGYAREACEAILRYCKDTLHYPRLAAITSPSNDKSNRLLEKLGFVLKERKDLDGRDTYVFNLDL